MALQMLASAASDLVDERRYTALNLLSGARMNADAMTDTHYNQHVCLSFASISIFLTQKGMQVLGRTSRGASTTDDVLDAVQEFESVMGPSIISRACSAAFFWRAAQIAAAHARTLSGAAKRASIQEAFYYASTAEFYLPPIRKVQEFVRLALVVFCVPSEPMMQLLEDAGNSAAAKIVSCIN